MNMQQPPLGTSHLIFCDSLVRVFTELRNLMDHYADSLWRRDYSLIISDGGVDEPMKNTRRNDPGRHA